MLTYNGSDLILAPIAGYSDSGMRSLCFRYGAGLCFTEMVSAKGLYYDNENTESLLKISKDEPNTGVQIFGSDPDIMAEVVNYDALKNFKIVDVNCGCPVQKIVRNGEGSALMHNPELVLKIVSSIRKFLSEDRKITVKIRKGIGGVICAKEVALAAQEGGASLVTVHGRTREQMYSGSVDYQVIKEVKDESSNTSLTREEIKNYASSYTGVEFEEKDLEINQTYLNAIKEGMLSVTNDVGGTASNIFKNSSITVAGKTGTSQVASG
ncbi:MAG: tRNA-dihydrouridine synthase, partial [Clostridia bacterium]|nr:tRNA-dihydrouridine synthase [Clostridia bacterium]